MNAYRVAKDCFATVFNDVTDQKMATLAYKKSESFLTKLLETIPMPVFYKDKEGRYLGVNKAFEDMFCKSKEELVGKTLFDINPPALAAIYQAKDKELFENGGVQFYQETVIDGCGKERYVSFYKATIVDDTGNINGLIGVMSDITDQKLAEDSLKKNEAFLSQLLETIPTPIFYKDRDGRYVIINKAFETLFWKKKEDIIGKTVFDIQSIEYAENADAEDKNLLKTPSNVAYFSQIEDGLGVVHEVIIQKASLKDQNGAIAGIIGSILDISDYRKVEDELRDTRQQLEEATQIASQLVQRKSRPETEA